MFPVGFSPVVIATRRTATSALPDAPVLDDEAATAPRSTRVRVSLTTALRGVAARATRAAKRY